MRNFRSNPAQRRDHYQELTDKIIAALEAGTAPWRRPWDKTVCGGATTPSMPPPATAIGASTSSSSACRRWLSRPTIRAGAAIARPAARGWQVRKGEKATPVYFYKPIEIEDKRSRRRSGDPAHPDPAHLLGLSRDPDRRHSRALRPRRSRRRPCRSASRMSRSCSRQAASLSGLAAIERSTVQRFRFHPDASGRSLREPGSARRYPASRIGARERPRFQAEPRFERRLWIRRIREGRTPRGARIMSRSDP